MRQPLRLSHWLRPRPSLRPRSHTQLAQARLKRTMSGRRAWLARSATGTSAGSGSSSPGSRTLIAYAILPG